MKLYIANKKYSSWSFRPWIALKFFNIDFEEILRPLDIENNCDDYLEFSPTGKVPTLIDDGNTVWESLAILEYLADKYPEKNLWPSNILDKTHARCISSEMHAGFMAIRNACPMNMSRNIEALTVNEDVKHDVKRIEEIWSQCLNKSKGPFLFGEFCIADAMYAPIVNRLHIYQLSKHPIVKSYHKTMTNLPEWQEWETAGKKESWIVGIDEA